MTNNRGSDSKKVRDEKSNEQAPIMPASLNQSGNLENQNHNTKKVALGPNTKR